MHRGRAPREAWRFQSQRIIGGKPREVSLPGVETAPVALIEPSRTRFERGGGRCALRYHGVVGVLHFIFEIVIEPIHIINAFDSTTRGSERAALALARLLAVHARVMVWSTTPSPPAVVGLAAQFGVALRQIRPFAGAFPRGGTLILWGTHFIPGRWLSAAASDAVLILSETFNFSSLYRAVLEVREAGLPEARVLYVSTLLRDSAQWPGGVLYPLPDMATLLRVEREAAPHPFTVGRVSRDIPEKHHADDPALYSALAAAGVCVRILGGTCLAARIPPHPLIELLPEGSVAVDRFLATLDTFFFRTGGDRIYVEPSGLAFAEAMVAGLPVVAGGPGGFTDLVVDGVNGYATGTQDEALHAILRLAQDESLRLRLGHASRAHVVDYFGPAYGYRFAALAWP